MNSPSAGASDTAAPEREGGRSGLGGLSRWWVKQSKLGMATALGLLAFYGFVFAIPFGIGIWLSFQNWDFISHPVFVGLSNYLTAFTDPYFWQALRATVLFSVVEICVGIALGLVVAYLLSRIQGIAQRVLLAAYYLPVVMPTIVTVFLWQLMYTPQGGLFNGVLTAVGLPAQQFTNGPNQALWSVTAMVIWAELGGGIVLFLATIKNVPTDVFEAAELDGAGMWRSFYHILVPLMRPVLVYQLVVSVIGTMQIFTQFYLVNGPSFSTRTLAVYTYTLGFQSDDLGYGAAISVLMFLGLLAATIVQLRSFRVQWEY